MNIKMECTQHNRVTTMNTERDETLRQVDMLRERLVRLYELLDKTGAEAESLRSARRAAEERALSAEEQLKKIQSMESTRNEEIQQLRRERDELKAEMDDIRAKLDRISELYREASAEQERLKQQVDVSDLLAIYILLIENIFGGKPHARILYTLHNTKTAITRKNLESSTGIMPTAIMKAIHDLRNADLVSFDEMTQEVRLLKDIL